jgi:hypothetical protein
MKKIIPIIIALIAAGIITIAVYWALRPQVITLQDGTKLTLLQVTYGRHHSLKGYKTDGRLWHGRSTLDTTNDTLVVWIESRQQEEAYQLFVYDRSNTACVGEWASLIGRVKAGTRIQAFTLNAFPRRDRKIFLRVDSSTGQFVISNPGPRSFPEWQPDPLPDTQSDGDLDVTLTKCVVGTPGFYPAVEDVPANDPLHQGVLLEFHTVQNGNVVTNWDPVVVETSDATGNHPPRRRWEIGRDTNNDATLKYQWGLWPDEPAWKLRVEMSRTSGWPAAETWSVNNVPIRPGTLNDLVDYTRRRRGNQAGSFAQGTINGHRVSLFPIIQITDQPLKPGEHPGGFYVAVEPDLTAGYQMSAIVTDEHGNKIQNWSPNNAGSYYTFWSPDMGNPKSLNITLALHQSRFVEFTVKPTTQ